VLVVVATVVVAAVVVSAVVVVPVVSVDVVPVVVVPADEAQLPSAAARTSPFFIRARAAWTLTEILTHGWLFEPVW
jgi:hypothetical protein